MSCTTGRRAANERRHPQTHRQGAVRQLLVRRRRLTLGHRVGVDRPDWQDGLQRGRAHLADHHHRARRDAGAVRHHERAQGACAAVRTQPAAVRGRLRVRQDGGSHGLLPAGLAGGQCRGTAAGGWTPGRARRTRAVHPAAMRVHAGQLRSRVVRRLARAVRSGDHRAHRGDQHGREHLHVHGRPDGEHQQAHVEPGSHVELHLLDGARLRTGGARHRLHPALLPGRAPPRLYLKENNMDPSENRLHALDAVRGFALLLGVAFHAAMSFLPGIPPGIWSMVDNSPSPFLADAGFVTHIFRMSLFFFIAGFFGRLLYHKLGARGFWKNRGLRIAVPLVAGWVVLFPIIGLVWSVGITQVFNGAPPAMPEMPKVPGAFPLTHLWFLYQLLMLYVAVTLLRAVFERIGDAPKQKLRALVDAGISAALRLNIGVFTFGIPVAAALMSLPFWLYWMGIPTPDSSLFPQLPATVGFFTAFVIGWLVNRSSDALAILAKKWWVNLVFAAIATGWLLHTSHVTPFAAPGTTKTVYAYIFGVAVWAWVFGLTGAALRFLSNYSAVRRYIADASYWIYLV